jgi:hypothetical protein
VAATLFSRAKTHPDGTRCQRSYGILVIAGVASEGAADPNAPVLEFWRLAHHDQGSDRNAIVEVDHVVIHQAEATRRYRVPDTDALRSSAIADRRAPCQRTGAECTDLQDGILTMDQALAARQRELAFSFRD